MNLDELVAIDVHVHVEVSDDGHPALPPRFFDAASKHFRADNTRPTVAEIAAYYRDLHMACVLFTVDAESATGHPPIANTEIATIAARHPDVLIPFASLDPARGAAAVREATRLVEQEGVRGFKFHPSLQNFAPSDRSVYPLYEAIEAAEYPPCSTVDKPASARDCPAVAVSGSSTATRWNSTTSPRTSRT